MPIPTGFNNTVRLVAGGPVGAAEINAELAAQNAAGYVMTSLEFVDANNCLLVFVKQDTTYLQMFDQKVNAVAVGQAAIDADKAAETPNGWWPTGIFVTPGGTLLIQYQLLDAVAP